MKKKEKKPFALFRPLLKQIDQINIGYDPKEFSPFVRKTMLKHIYKD